MNYALPFFLAAAISVNAAGVTIRPGDRIKDSVNAYPANTSFLITAGVYRGQQIPVKDGNVFEGEDGAVLNGSRVLDSWTKSGAYWIHTGLADLDNSRHGECMDAYPGCNFSSALFMDSEFITRDTSLDGLASGRWYLDETGGTAYIADDPAGRTLEVSDTRYAIGCDSTVNNVTIRNLIFEKYASPAQDGAIRARGDSRGWRIEQCEVRYNHGGGISLHGTRHLVRQNLIHHNGQIGFATTGDTLLVFERNDVAYNNALGFSSGWEAGGTKFVLTDSAVIRYNWVHHNFHAPGLWSDISNSNISYEANIVEYNGTAGIMHEISGRGRITCNIARYNGADWSVWAHGANIAISHSSNVEIDHNIVEISAMGEPGSSGGHGINVIYQPSDGDRMKLMPRNISVHDNHITWKGDYTGTHGLACDHDTLVQNLAEGTCAGRDTMWDSVKVFFFSAGNAYNGNHYHVPQGRDGYISWRYRIACEDPQAICPCLLGGHNLSSLQTLIDQETAGTEDNDIGRQYSCDECAAKLDSVPVSADFENRPGKFPDGASARFCVRLDPRSRTLVVSRINHFGKTAHIRILNMQGRTVARGTIREAETGIAINLITCSRGLYIASVSDDYDRKNFTIFVYK